MLISVLDAKDVGIVKLFFLFVLSKFCLKKEKRSYYKIVVERTST